MLQATSYQQSIHGDDKEYDYRQQQEVDEQFHFSQQQENQNNIDSQRRQEILMKLQQEREMRRKYVHEGKSEQFKLETITSQQNNIEQQQKAQYQNNFMSEMKNPHDIMFSTQKDQIQVSNSKSELVQKLLNERRINKSQQSIPQQIHETSQNSIMGGFNPEFLYQQDVQDQLQSQDQYIHTSQSSNLKGSYQQDSKYRDAVDYTKAQIMKERQKQLELNQAYSQQQSSVSDNRNYMQNRFIELQQEINENNIQQEPLSSRRQYEQSNQLTPRDFQAVPTNLNKMGKQIATQFSQKSFKEMNQRNEQRDLRHNFKQEEENNTRKKLMRPQSAANIKGEYMKNTISADLKKGTQPTSQKSKQLISQVERKEKEELTFKPEIHEYPVPPSKEVSKEERWKKLTEPKTIEIQKRDKIKLQQQIEETQKNCPFKPQIPKSARKVDKYNSMTLEERLLHEADLRKEKREKLKRELDMEQMKDCSFKPQLLTSSSPIVNINKFSSKAPLHQRVGELQKEKNEKLQKLRVQNELDQQDLTFKPQVNKKSEKIAQVKRCEEDQMPQNVVERLYKDASDRIEKQLHFSESVHDQLSKDHPFHPQISKSSNYISEKSDMFNGNLKEFHERQQAFLEKQLEKRELMKNQHSDAAKCTFKPEINVTSEIIVESDPKRSNETEQQKFMRLYQKDYQKQEVIKEILEKEVYDQYTFQPQINKISKTLAKNTSLDELAYNKKRQEKIEKLSQQYESQEFADCTFKPLTIKSNKYKNVSPHYNLSQDPTGEEFSLKLKQQLKEKQEKIAQERREREYQMLKDCTFKPQVLDTIPSTAKEEVVIVKGLGRHLELKELQKKKEEEKKLREAEVFGLYHKFSVNANELDITNPNRSFIQNKLNITSQGYTVPQPFELSSGINSDQRKTKLLKELKEKEMQEYTFKPNTNEGRNKKLIQEILEDANKENGFDDQNILRYHDQYEL